MQFILKIFKAIDTIHVICEIAQVADNFKISKREEIKIHVL